MSTLYERTASKRKSAAPESKIPLTANQKAQIVVNHYVFGVPHDVNALEFHKCNARMSEVCRLKDYLHKQNSADTLAFLAEVRKESASVGYKLTEVDWTNRILKFAPVKNSAASKNTSAAVKNTSAAASKNAAASKKITAAQKRLNAKIAAASKNDSAVTSESAVTSDESAASK